MLSRFALGFVARARPCGLHCAGTAFANAGLVSLVEGSGKAHPKTTKVVLG